MAAVCEAFPRISHRYYAMKAKWLGKDKLMHWDRNAPLPDEDTREVPWAEARDMVLSAYGAFSPDMAAIARNFFERNWIDAPVRPGKSPGAFAHPTVPSAHPYVLLNYLGKTRDVMTLAHELGHGVHQVLAAGQGAPSALWPGPVLEPKPEPGLEQGQSVQEEFSQEELNHPVRRRIFSTKFEIASCQLLPHGLVELQG